MRVRAWALGCLCACVALAAQAGERSLAIYPAQELPLRFDHGQHLADGADCLTCHDSARKSTQAADRLVPVGSAAEHPTCDPCHEIRNDAATCAQCHPGFDATVQKAPEALVLPRAELVFSHRAHFERHIACETCHEAMAQVGLATRMQLPKMKACLGCHDGTTAPAECRTCHLRAPTGRLQLQFTSGLLRPMAGNPLGLDHGPRFEFGHGTRAKLDRSTCMQCHGESECEKCHNGTQKPLSVHPNDFIALHPIEARTGSLKCDSCHRYQSFCAACHERAGIGLSAAAFFRSRNVRIHPNYETWVNDVHSPEHHSIRASRNIQECIGCHRQEDCLPCHSVNPANGIPQRLGYSPPGVDPHPASFLDGCLHMLRNNPRPCQLCHAAGSKELQCVKP